MSKYWRLYCKWHNVNSVIRWNLDRHFGQKWEKQTRYTPLNTHTHTHTHTHRHTHTHYPQSIKVKSWRRLVPPYWINDAIILSVRVFFKLNKQGELSSLRQTIPMTSMMSFRIPPCFSHPNGVWEVSHHRGEQVLEPTEALGYSHIDFIIMPKYASFSQFPSVIRYLLNWLNRCSCTGQH